MEYLELLAAYNKEKKKLLIRPIIEKNLPYMSKVHQEMYFMDPRFYNLKLSKEENLKIKKEMASLLNYNELIISGAVKDNMLFIWTKGFIKTNHFVFYIPGGLIEWETDGFRHQYKFFKNTYVDKIYIKTILYTTIVLPYISINERLSKIMYEHGKLLGKYFSALLINENKEWYFIFKRNDIISKKILDIFDQENISVQIQLDQYSDTLMVIKGYGSDNKT